MNGDKNKIDTQNMSDHDLLIRVATLIEIVLKGQDNHLEHHRRRDIAMLTVTIGAIFTSIIAIGGAILAIIIK